MTRIEYEIACMVAIEAHYNEIKSYAKAFPDNEYFQKRSKELEEAMEISKIGSLDKILSHFEVVENAPSSR